MHYMGQFSFQFTQYHKLFSEAASDLCQFRSINFSLILLSSVFFFILAVIVTAEILLNNFVQRIRMHDEATST